MKPHPEQRHEKFVVADDNAMERDAIARRLSEALPNLAIAKAANIEELLKIAEAQKPEYISLDSSLGATDAIQYLTELHSISKQSRVFVVSHFMGGYELYRIDQASKLGQVAGAFQKDELFSQELKPLIQAMQSRDGFRWSRVFQEKAHSFKEKIFNILSDQECIILAATGANFAKEEIAAALDIKEETVETHLKHIRRTLNINEVSPAVLRRRALDLNLVRSDILGLRPIFPLGRSPQLQILPKLNKRKSSKSLSTDQTS